MWDLLSTLLGWFLGLFKTNTRDDEVALGKAQQQVADGKGDIAVVRKANQAAQSISEKGVADDESNLDRSL